MNEEQVLLDMKYLVLEMWMILDEYSITPWEADEENYPKLKEIIKRYNITKANIFDGLEGELEDRIKCSLGLD